MQASAQHCWKKKKPGGAELLIQLKKVLFSEWLMISFMMLLDL
jgi:hypothetical protein